MNKVTRIAGALRGTAVLVLLFAIASCSDQSIGPGDEPACDLESYAWPDMIGTVYRTVPNQGRIFAKDIVVPNLTPIDSAELNTDIGVPIFLRGPDSSLVRDDAAFRSEEHTSELQSH